MFRPRRARAGAASLCLPACVASCRRFTGGPAPWEAALRQFAGLAEDRRTHSVSAALLEAFRQPLLAAEVRLVGATRREEHIAAATGGSGAAAEWSAAGGRVPVREGRFQDTAEEAHAAFSSLLNALAAARRLALQHSSLSLAEQSDLLRTAVSVLLESQDARPTDVGTGSTARDRSINAPSGPLARRPREPPAAAIAHAVACLGEGKLLHIPLHASHYLPLLKCPSIAAIDRDLPLKLLADATAAIAESHQRDGCIPHDAMARAKREVLEAQVAAAGSFATLPGGWTHALAVCNNDVPAAMTIESLATPGHWSASLHLLARLLAAHPEAYLRSTAIAEAAAVSFRQAVETRLRARPSEDEPGPSGADGGDEPTATTLADGDGAPLPTAFAAKAKHVPYGESPVVPVGAGRSEAAESLYHTWLGWTEGWAEASDAARAEGRHGRWLTRKMVEPLLLAAPPGCWADGLAVACCFAGQYTARFAPGTPDAANATMRVGEQLPLGVVLRCLHRSFQWQQVLALFTRTHMRAPNPAHRLAHGATPPFRPDVLGGAPWSPADRAHVLMSLGQAVLAQHDGFTADGLQTPAERLAISLFSGDTSSSTSVSGDRKYTWRDVVGFIDETPAADRSKQMHLATLQILSRGGRGCPPGAAWEHCLRALATTDPLNNAFVDLVTWQLAHAGHWQQALGTFEEFMRIRRRRMLQGSGGNTRRVTRWPQYAFMTAASAAAANGNAPAVAKLVSLGVARTDPWTVMHALAVLVTLRPGGEVADAHIQALLSALAADPQMAPLLPASASEFTNLARYFIREVDTAARYASTAPPAHHAYIHTLDDLRTGHLTALRGAAPPGSRRTLLQHAWQDTLAVVKVLAQGRQERAPSAPFASAVDLLQSRLRGPTPGAAAAGRSSNGGLVSGGGDGHGAAPSPTRPAQFDYCRLLPDLTAIGVPPEAFLS